MDPRTRQMIDRVAEQCGVAYTLLNLDSEWESQEPECPGHSCSQADAAILNPRDARAGFSDVDRTADPGAFVGLLDTITAMDFATVYKRRTYDALAPRPGAIILDIGCGTGEDARALARFVDPGGRVVGVDRSETVVAEARNRTADTDGQVEFRVGDAHRLAFPDASFDGCRADRVLHHLDDPRQAIAEMVRVARPGAPIVAFEPDFETALVDAADQVMTRRLLNRYCDGYRQGWMGRRLPALFRAAGLRDVAVESVAVLLTTYGQGNTILDLEGTARRAAEEGLVSADEAKAWLEHLRAGDRSGQFFGAISCFLVRGRKA